MRRSSTRRRSGHIGRLAVATVVVVVLATASSPSHAGIDWSKATIQVPARVCRSDGAYLQIGAQVRLWEHGKSGVTRLRAKFRLYNADVSPGWNYPRLERTYSSVSFRNDHRTLGSYLPLGFVHRWDNVFATRRYRLDVKATWERPWRPDWNHQWPVLYCGSVVGTSAPELSPPSASLPSGRAPSRRAPSEGPT